MKFVLLLIGLGFSCLLYIIFMFIGLQGAIVNFLAALPGLYYFNKACALEDKERQKDKEKKQ